MSRTSFKRVAALVIASLTLASSAAFAADRDAAAHRRASNSFVPGATEQWCESLAYPYCSTPAPGTPGSGPAPYVHPAPSRPIFGGD